MKLEMLVEELADEIAHKVREKLAGDLPVGPRLLTLDKAAEYLCCTTEHVRALVEAGWFKPVKWFGGERPKPYFDVVDLEQAIQRAKRNGE